MWRRVLLRPSLAYGFVRIPPRCTEDVIGMVCDRTWYPCRSGFERFHKILNVMYKVIDSCFYEACSSTHPGLWHLSRDVWKCFAHVIIVSSLFLSVLLLKMCLGFLIHLRNFNEPLKLPTHAVGSCFEGGGDVQARVSAGGLLVGHSAVQQSLTWFQS